MILIKISFKHSDVPQAINISLATGQLQTAQGPLNTNFSLPNINTTSVHFRNGSQGMSGGGSLRGVFSSGVIVQIQFFGEQLIILRAWVLNNVII